MANVAFKIGQTPEQAVEFLRQKKMLAAKVFTKDLKESALARAATIARLSSAEMTKDIYQSLETAMREGKPLHQWKKELVGEFERKGWLAGHDKKISKGIDGKLLADPKTGEYFGTPRRLNTIYRVNMQAAYSAARYQRLRDNVDNRPYWQYSAVGDARTRPAHLALSGKIYRYDDPFWTTFYPPNGFNCRCTVIALSDRDLARRGIEEVGDSAEFLVEATRPADKFGNKEKTVGFKLADGTVRIADKGFDYNVGRMSYKPNLDLYPEKLAHQFAKVEMTGAEFRLDYKRLEQQVSEMKRTLSSEGKKLTAEQMFAVRDNLTKNFKFAAGVLTEESKALMKSNTATVWLSDDTLIKQFNSRDGQDFGVDTYALFPELFNQPETILQESDRFYFIKNFENKRLLAVVKNLTEFDEIFVLSAREINIKEVEKLKGKLAVIK
ncbi:phage minor head protein [Haemophilus parahaemolyticus]|uniref:phage head morphogenesis protein n=1 Tax=Haemophilus parahaemolyticus TaxID=735 RepID=UPI0028EC8BD2|nr:phage minor head protein [Haemophilus parahaemolyticus]